MNPIQIIRREMTAVELARMRIGFDEHTIEQNVAVQSADRFSFTAEANGQFVGCVSGLVYKNDDEYSGWSYLTDLFVEKEFRIQGLGRSLLRKWEADIREVGVKHVYTWTAGYEAPAFYRKQGYHIFTEMEHWYSDGSSRVGLRKTLIPLLNIV
ncbi:MAG: GNAT family N-acetyltransferase [Saprospiraceae bacterium]